MIHINSHSGNLTSTALIWDRVKFDLARRFRADHALNCMGVHKHFFGEKLVLSTPLTPGIAETAALLDKVPVAILLIDAVGQIQHLNVAAENMFGYQKSELVGCSVDVLVPNAVRQKHKKLREEFFRSPNSRIMGEGRRLVARCKDGHEIPISISLSPMMLTVNPIVIVASVIDNSAQERAARAELLVRELTHRAKNMFAVISAMSHRIGAASADVASFQNEFDDRLHSLSASHELLAHEDWKSVLVADLVRAQLAFVSGCNDQVFIAGAALRISASKAEYLGLALHELATNALKHGALSVSGGKVHAVWTIDAIQGRFLFDWREQDGPPVTEPLRKGFGSVILKTVVSAVFGGRAEFHMRPNGAWWHLEAPLDSVLVEVPTLPAQSVSPTDLSFSALEKAQAI